MSNVSTEILRLLGGRKFLFITGAMGSASVVGGENYLQFSLPRGCSKNKATKVIIRLETNDTYTMIFYKWSHSDLIEIETIADIYVDTLQEIFTNRTGLYTSL